jgi:hypothetical protein
MTFYFHLVSMLLCGNEGESKIPACGRQVQSEILGGNE